MKKNVDEQYLELLQDILENGNKKKTRSGEVLSIFGTNMKIDMREGFPLLTTKKMFTRGVIHELLWFLKGDTNIKYLLDNDVHIWDDDAYRWYCELIDNNNFIINNIDILTSDLSNEIEYNYPFIDKVNKEVFLEKCKSKNKLRLIKGNIRHYCFDLYKYGDLGDIYGKSWRKFGVSHTDQIQNIIDTLKTNPDDRRMLCINYNPDTLKHVALAPCHIMFQFYTRELTINERWELYFNKFKNETPNSYFTQPHIAKYAESQLFLYNGDYDEELDKEEIPKRELSCSFYCRSQDVPLGTPFNLASYAFLTHMIAQACNMSVGDLIYNGGDCHIYMNQIEEVKEQLNRNPNEYKSPKLWLNPEIKNIDDFTIDDIKIVDYQSYPTIKFPLSVGQ